MRNAWLIACILGFIIIISAFFSRQGYSFIAILAYPFLKAEAALIQPIQASWIKWHRYKDIRCTLEESQQSVIALRKEVIELKAILSYMEDTKDIRSFRKRYCNTNTIVAQILLCSLDEREHMLIVDAGSSRGIRHGMIAVYNHNLLGKVTEVTRYWSKVTLLTDKSCKIAAICAQTQTEGIVEGQQDIAVLKLTFVDHLCPITVGDYVLSMGDGYVFPRGFNLGTISTASIQDCTYSINIQPSFDIRSLRYCLLIEKGAEYCSKTR